MEFSRNEILNFIESKCGIVAFHTSGTTTERKTIEKSYENMKAESDDLFYEFGFKGDLEFISTTTPKHLFGFTFHYMLPLTHGFKSNPHQISYPEEINVRNAVLVTTPSFLEVMRKYGSVPPVKPKYIITSGAKLEDETFRYALSISENVIEIYGSTETGIIGYRTTPDTDKLKLFRSVKIKRTNEKGTVISTPYSLEKEHLIGDRVEKSRGFIKLLGRCDRIMKNQEKRISANEIEEVINENSFVEKSYCFEKDGKIAMLVVPTEQGRDFILKNGTLELEKEIKSFLRKRFEVVPQKFRFWYEIPTRENGKIDKQQIYRMFELNLSLSLVLSVKRDENSAIIDMVFLKNSNFFKGHFDEFSILPGVVQLFYANYFSQNFWNLDCHQGQLRRIKFSDVIFPDNAIKLELTKTDTTINYVYKDEKQTYSSGSLPIINNLQ